MTKEEFETIINPLILLDGKNYQFMRSALLGNFKKWNEAEQLRIAVVSQQSELVCEHKFGEEYTSIGGTMVLKECKKCKEVQTCG